MKYLSLKAVALALAVALLVVVGTVLFARHFEMVNEREVAPYFFPQKVTGSALQRLAFKIPHYLPIYGSSELGSYELQKLVKAKPGDFFIQKPTGFIVFPVGRGGTTPLVMLQEIAAVGPLVRGHKVVIIISPNWFARAFSASQFAGNTSILHTGSVTFGHFSQALKRDVARRLEHFPEPLAKSDLFHLEADLYAGGKPWQTTAAHFLMPFGRAWLASLRVMDDVVTLKQLVELKQNHLHELPPPTKRTVHWAKEERNSEAASDLEAVNAPPDAEDPGPPVYRPGEIRKMGNGKEFPPEDIFSASEVWGDYELLLRVLQEAGADAMILSVPLDGDVSDHDHTPYAMRKLYYDRLRSLATAHGFPAFTFEEHEYDGNFLIKHVSHLTEKGWLYFDQMIDAFYHDKIPKPKPEGAR